MTRALIPSDYARTRIIGFSVTHSWWPGFRAAIPNPSAWELKWYSGGSVDHWADTNDIAWTYGGADPVNTGGVIDPVGGSDNESAVDRVIFNISGLSAALHPPGGYSNNVEEWRGYIANAIAAIRTHHPTVRMIILQPAIAGPSFGTCPSQSTTPSGAGYDSGGFSAGYGVVRCTYTQPAIQSAIMALTRGNVRGGYMPQASSCADFRDSDGHVFTAAEIPTGQAVAAYYANNL